MASFPENRKGLKKGLKFGSETHTQLLGESISDELSRHDPFNKLTNATIQMFLVPLAYLADLLFVVSCIRLILFQLTNTRGHSFNPAGAHEHFPIPVMPKPCGSYQLLPQTGLGRLTNLSRPAGRPGLASRNLNGKAFPPNPTFLAPFPHHRLEVLLHQLKGCHLAAVESESAYGHRPPARPSATM